MRELTFVNGEIYHVFNRGVEKRLTFTTTRDYERGIQTLDYYHIQNPPIRFSYFLRLSKEARTFAIEKLQQNSNLVDLLSYCLMPNHFHFLLRQSQKSGISKFIANFSNSYTKYFNTKYKRVGHLFQGTFKAVQIETDEQLMHVSRYIHLNPVTSFIIRPGRLKDYPWSSYVDYLRESQYNFIDTDTIMNLFKSTEAYEKFVLDQVDYARNLEIVQHLTLEEY